MIERVHPWIWAAALCVLFTALGVVFLPFPGAQYDEVLFVSAIYAPETVEYAMKTGFGAIPVMLITYAGTLKAAIYAPLLAWFGSSHVVLRLPMLVAAALSVGLYFLAARRLAGTKAALLTGLLLATDAIYLLTSVFDWGPVALQHLLFAGALYAGVRYREQARVRWMAVMALCAGLALWDKAIIVWLLAGFGVSALVVLRGEVMVAARNRRLALAAVLGFVIGAAPFLYYNKIHPLRTFTSSTEMDRQPALQKIVALDRTFSGGGLFGYLVREDPEGFPQGLQTWEKAPLWLNGKLQGPRQSIQQLVLLGAFLSLPLVWGTGYRRVWLFLALAAVIGWLLMLVTANAGGAMHHTILLWPIPQMLAALALAGAFLSLRRLWLGAPLALAVLGAGGWGVYELASDKLRVEPRVERVRNFYGTIYIDKDWDTGLENDYVTLVHGGIIHGMQNLGADYRQEPVTYYGHHTGIGRALDSIKARPGARVGIVGLGSGTAACYAQQGQAWRFYEINPEIVRLAEKHFTYLADARTRGAEVSIHTGDARLTLEREEAQKFDVLLLDAFSGDAIPMHLLTREAFDIYARHMAPEGIIVVHVTNSYLTLAPVVERQAEALGWGVTRIMTQSEGDHDSTDYVMVTKNAQFLKDTPVEEPEDPEPEGIPLWTDRYHNLFQILMKE
ncbi:MAG TPA: hypothetical protein DCY80_14430 [Solibacterales bacterium]|nr:hypothetical protein [Bryobacterales bacterium]